MPTTSATTTNDTMRARGWSIQSEGTRKDEDEEEEEPLSMEEKLHLLNTMPATTTTTTTTTTTMRSVDDDDHCYDNNNGENDYYLDVKEKEGNADHQNNNSKNNNSTNGNRKRSRSDMTDATDTTGIDNEKSNDSLDKQQLNDSQPKNDNHSNNNNHKRPKKLFELAQQRLSKWAARLFDPNRPRGLVETPAEIPLNDEFLQAFGRREKAMDAQLGKAPLSIDREIIDETDQEDNYNDEDGLLKPASKRGGPASKATTTISADSSSNNRKSKVKITNIPFALTPSALKAVCAQFGPVTDCNLLMDDDNETRNLGRAYVTFEDADSAQACVDGLHELEGRPLRITLAEDSKKKPPTSGRGSAAGGAGGGTGDRYWEEDITTKCFRCGQVGHIGAHCTNTPKVQPCPLCSKTDHDLRSCPVRVVCFNCGITGFIASKEA